MPNNKMSTVYDIMTAKGMFRSNPANVDSVDEVTGDGLYRGPVPYPRMLYHPKGKVIVTGQKALGSISGEIEHVIVHNAVEEEEYKAKGWHSHPADAIEASGLPAPPKSSAVRIESLEDTVAKLKKELEEAKASLAAAGGKKEPEEEQPPAPGAKLKLNPTPTPTIKPVVSK